MCALMRGGKRSVCIQRVLHRYQGTGQVQYSVAYLVVAARRLNAGLESWAERAVDGYRSFERSPPPASSGQSREFK